MSIARITGVAAVCLIAAASCTTTNCDARAGDPGFFANTACQLSGVYNDQTESLKLELAEAKELNEQLDAALKALDAEAAEVRAEAEAQNFEYEKLNKAMQPLLASLDENAAENAALQAKVDALRADLDALNAGGSTSSAQKTLQLEELRRKMNLLQAELGLDEISVGT